MELATIEVEKEEVEREIATIKQALKDGYITKRTTIARDLMAVYGHLKHGGKVVDIFRAFHATGLGDDGHPRLAIAPFSATWCYLYEKRRGSAIFSSENKDSWKLRAIKGIGDIEFPPDTFDFDEEKLKNEGTRWRTVAPIVPPRIIAIASAKLTPQNYHVIFEPELWAKAKVPRPPGDPILGKMLTPNLFGVVATWDLTELETAILRGRLK